MASCNVFLAQLEESLCWIHQWCLYLRNSAWNL